LSFVLIVLVKRLYQSPHVEKKRHRFQINISSRTVPHYPKLQTIQRGQTSFATKEYQRATLSRIEGNNGEKPQISAHLIKKDKSFLFRSVGANSRISIHERDFR